MRGKPLAERIADAQCSSSPIKVHVWQVQVRRGITYEQCRYCLAHEEYETLIYSGPRPISEAAAIGSKKK